MRLLLLLLCVSVLLAGCMPPRIEMTAQEAELVHRMRFSKGAEEARLELIGLHPEWPEATRQAVLAKEIPWTASPSSLEEVPITRLPAIAAWGPPSKRSGVFGLTLADDFWTYTDVEPPIELAFGADRMCRRPDYTEIVEGGYLIPPRGKFGYQKVDATTRP